MSDLDKYREQIDTVDKELVRLFQKRVGIVEHIAEYKIRSGKDVFDRKREQEKLETLTKYGDTDFMKSGIKELFNQIMAICRKRQYQLIAENGVRLPRDYAVTKKLYFHRAHVVFQGIEGAYSSEAMKSFFDNSIESSHVETWREAMEMVADGDADFAVLPIENSTAGIVSDIYDLLLEFDNYIVGEQILPIHHVLLGTQNSSLEQVRTVYSHPQAIAQCREFLDSHPDWKRRELLNTAVAAEKVLRDNDPSRAAIASRSAASFLGLKILKEGISSGTNATRFIIVSHHRMFVESANKISICFGLPHACGTLYQILGHFIFNGLSMIKIESRPIPDMPFEYRFFIDFEGNLGEAAVRNALKGIQEEADGLKLLGNY